MYCQAMEYPMGEASEVRVEVPSIRVSVREVSEAHAARLGKAVEDLTPSELSEGYMLGTLLAIEAAVATACNLLPRPTCGVCLQPVQEVETTRDAARKVTIATIRCHGQSEVVEVPDDVLASAAARGCIAFIEDHEHAVRAMEALGLVSGDDSDDREPSPLPTG